MTAFGIDLGSTNSCIAYVDDTGHPVVARNAIGRETTPSVVYFEKPGSVVVGGAARNSALLAPHLVAERIKREMGREDVAFTYHGEARTPETISAFILRELAQSAGRQTGEPVRDVVITVPAYFGVREREATRKAGRIAGLNVLDVLDEPIAAALSYQSRRPSGGVRHVLVYDLGGGTFDTTVIRLEGDDIRAVCTGGDLRLGGADWDERVVRYMLEAFTRQCPGLDPTADEQFMHDLAIGAEVVKMELSSALAWTRHLRFGGATAEVEMTRATLEELTADLLERTLDITEKTVGEARRRKVETIDEVILVGGMTKMPVVRERLRERLGLEARRHEPELAVAKGAALFALVRQASREPGGGPEEIADRLGISASEAAVMTRRSVTTVVPRGFGVRVADQNDPLFATDPGRARTYVIHLLPANTPLPADSGAVSFATSIDNQPMAEVEVWEQKEGTSSDEVSDNACVARGRLRLPPRLPALSRLDVSFAVDETGRLTVHAEEPMSGNELDLELQIGGMDEAAVSAARTAVARHDVSS
ncbi:Hsp70 family protein [Actinomadura sp. DC4]|uniref:Hsp70 family protein n=1 Tax=Actinomadura sp. DC4 TaxID=3055069 RepID=UPI0025B14AA5|nr:Hsp70 family protein [Actinomadura sp. DC4]MDN3353861.1 Hsp70 family protein [Actinomadura sp. DC4]